MSKKIVYTAVFVERMEMKEKYPQVHPNLYGTHSTIEFEPDELGDLPVGKKMTLKIIGRLTNDKVDVLVVDNPLSTNKVPHITLSTAEGVEPVESNDALENNTDKIEPLSDSIEGVVGYYTGKTEVTEA